MTCEHELEMCSICDDRAAVGLSATNALLVLTDEEKSIVADCLLVERAHTGEFLKSLKKLRKYIQQEELNEKLIAGEEKKINTLNSVLDKLRN